MYKFCIGMPALPATDEKMVANSTKKAAILAMPIIYNDKRNKMMKNLATCSSFKDVKELEFRLDN